MAKAIPEDTWPSMVRWLGEPPIIAPQHLESARDREIVGIEVADIAGMVPAVGGNFGRGLRILVMLVQDISTAETRCPTAYAECRHVI
jgi:hypothetical protein